MKKRRVRHNAAIGPRVGDIQQRGVEIHLRDSAVCTIFLRARKNPAFVHAGEASDAQAN